MLYDFVFAKITLFSEVLPPFAQKLPLLPFCSIAKTTCDDLLNGKVEETVILLVQAVRDDIMEICKNANRFCKCAKTVCFP
jgi:histone H3/H4